MKRVAIISGLAERCGMTTYAQNLQAQLSQWYLVFLAWSYYPELCVGDAIIINYHPATTSFSMDDLRQMKASGAKVIIIHHENDRRTLELAPSNPFAVVDAVVTHDPIPVALRDGARANFRLIPHGIPDVSIPEGGNVCRLEHTPVVGTCGFAFTSKRFDVTVRAAQAIKGNVDILAARHPTSDAAVLARYPSETASFLSEREVIERLSRHDMNVYFADEPAGPGQSGSVRMMLAARRPVIVRRCPKTSMLDGYADEIYFAGTEDDVCRIATEIWGAMQRGEPVKIPQRVISETGWPTVGTMYRDLIEELLCLV